VSLALAPDVLRICEPPPALTVSEWSDAERLLPESSAARGAAYRTAFVEYLRGVMDNAIAPGVTRLAVMKAHQCGASEALYNILAYHMVHRPSPMLLVMPTADAGQAVAKERIGDLIRSSPAVGAIVQSKRSPGRLLWEWRQELVRDVGGEAAISTQQLAVIDLAVKTKLLLDSIDAWLLTQPSLIDKRRRALLPVVRERQALADALARYMELLGLERKTNALDLARALGGRGAC
jgi:hypothetical protein